MRLVGFDPGLTGGVVFLDTEAKTLAAYSMPTITRKNGKSHLDEGALANLIGSHKPTIGIMEDVYSSPEMGPVSSFTFGEGKGVLKGVLAGCGVERRYVSPARWKADLRTSADKAHSKELARSVFPACRKLLSNEGKCEAALIVLWLALDLGCVPVGIQPVR